MNYANPDALVSTEWLAEHLDAPDVRIIDATSFLPTVPRNAREEYDACHIPGAVFFDINDIADSDNPLPHMLPSAEKFSSKVRKLGLGDGNRIIAYDGNGGSSASCRAWWMFRLFGHDDVAVLNGGLPKWVAEGRPTEDLPPVPRERHFTARQNNFLVRNVKQLIENIRTGREQVIDVRSPGRFAGTDPEPRPVRKKGHIPGSLNLPFPLLMDPKNGGVFRSAEQIRTVFDDAGADLSRPIVASCGSGVTACVAAFALYLIGYNEAAVYDGSWAEWGDHFDTPVDAG
jgi:thiosulfate/3-mercaptopyruvate sulfurtransferase